MRCPAAKPRENAETMKPNSELAKTILGWSWIFDEQLVINEASILEYVRFIDENAPELARLVVRFPWLADNVDRWETSAVSDLYALVKWNQPDFAMELAASPWVTDGVTFLEVLFGMHPLKNIAISPDTDSGDPQMARKIMGLIKYPPDVLDLSLIISLGNLREHLSSDLQTGLERHNPDRLNRLFMEPWVVDGLDEEERIYLIAASGAARWDEFYEPYTIESATIALPHTGNVNLWAVQYGPFPSGPSILAQMEEAVRGSEQFWELPFPVDDVILFLEDGQKCRLKGRLECRGKHIGRLMFLYTDGGNLSSGTVNHEVAHYYFKEGPSWFTEGGAQFVMFYLANDGNVPVVEFPDYCAEQGIDNLQALNNVGSGPDWDTCRYPMGLHFLVALRETMGEDAWLSALRAFYLEFGYEGLHVSTSDSPEDEEVYQVFIEHAPPELVDEVRDIFRRLHGGPFVDTEN